MRAKRSKKYRKLMQQYEVAFGFREPYQVLVDSHFLKAVHAFKMDFLPALERTLQGKVKPFITKCTLNAITSTAAHNPSPAGSDTRTHSSRQSFRPAELPPPTVLPLRYCSHNAENQPIDESDCLLSLLAPKESEDGTKRNKEHYILATADPIAPKQANKARPDRRKEAEFAALQKKAGHFRWQARQIPGVPIVYVKRSVMILEPLSGGSERIRVGIERDKFREGIKEPGTTVGKRKRDETGAEKSFLSKPAKKVKGPNPLSVKKPKKRDNSAQNKKKSDSIGEKELAREQKSEDTTSQAGQVGEKVKRKRRHKSRQIPNGEEKNTEEGISNLETTTDDGKQEE
ncbi:Small subunit processome component [Ascosphaera aggregata]|nr:Small subunit processome component [Ascosphaera aggregata]